MIDDTKWPTRLRLFFTKRLEGIGHKNIFLISVWEVYWMWQWIRPSSWVSSGDARRFLNSVFFFFPCRTVNSSFSSAINLLNRLPAHVYNSQYNPRNFGENIYYRESNSWTSSTCADLCKKIRKPLQYFSFLSRLKWNPTISNIIQLGARNETRETKWTSFAYVIGIHNTRIQIPCIFKWNSFDLKIIFFVVMSDIKKVLFVCLGMCSFHCLRNWPQISIILTSWSAEIDELR